MNLRQIPTQQNGCYTLQPDNKYDTEGNTNMTSKITTYSDNIDTNFPVQGQDNPSQGFRDNFAQIRLALDTAATELTSVLGGASSSSYTLLPPQGSFIGGVKAGSNVTISPDGTLSVATPYVLPAADEVTLGGVKVDGITINSTNGVISAIANGYVLPTATTTTLGGIIIGPGLKITSSVLTIDQTVPLPYAIPVANEISIGGVKRGSNVSIGLDGTISVAAPYVLPAATSSALGGVKQGANVTISGDGTLSIANPYTLITATSITLGGVKIGSNISAAGDGTISVAAPYVLTTATANTLGGIKIGANLSIDGGGVVSGAPAYTLPVAGNTVLGGIKIGNNLSMDAFGFLNGSYGLANSSVAGIVKIGTSIRISGDGTIDMMNPFVLSNYTTSTLSNIESTSTGAMVFVTNAPGGAQPCYFDGTAWYTVNGRTQVV